MRRTIFPSSRRDKAPVLPRYPLSKMTADAVEVLRDRKRVFPEAANGRVKAIRQVFNFGVQKKHAPFNPVRDVPCINTGSTGFRMWGVSGGRKSSRARRPQGARDYRRGEQRDHEAANGNLPLGLDPASRSLHTRRGAKADGSRCHASDRSARRNRSVNTRCPTKGAL